MKLLLTLTLLLPSIATAGFDTGNAGDAYSAEFLYTARDVLQRLELLEREGTRTVDLAKLRRAIEVTKVISEERVYLDGHERDAVNYPSQQLIKLGRLRWKALRAPSETRARLTLVFHEFLWIMRTDDSNFAVSQPIIDKLKVPGYSPAVWMGVEGLPFATIECAGILRDGSFVTVRVATKGATKTPDSGSVEFEKEENRYGYRFGAAEIAQFFEFDNSADNTAMVGLSAFVSGESPVSVKYSGKNFVDMDLRAVLLSGEQRKMTGNKMRIWRGPGHASSDVIEFQRPVCSVSSNN